MKSLKIFLALLFVSAAIYGQNCNITVVPTSVTCFGSGDGKAEVYKDGKLIVLGSGNNTGNPATCVSPETSPYSCGSPVPGAVLSSDSIGVVEIPDGKTLYLTSSSFNGSIRFLGTNTLVVCGAASIQNFEMNNNSKPITIIVNGQATLTSQNINLDHQSVVRNYGTLTLSKSIGFNGKLFNHGILTAVQNLDINGGTGQFYNAGRVNIKGTFNNYNTATNGGVMDIQGDFNNNGGSGFINLCTINILNNFSNSTTIDNFGKIAVSNTTTVGGGKLYKGNSSSLLSTKDLHLNGIFEGTGSNCASVKVSGSTIINGSGILRGLIDLCDATGIETNGGSVQSPATTNCSCNANGSGSGVSGTVTWSSGTSTLGGSTVTGLSAGTYSVNISLEECNSVNPTFTITTPSKITASVSVNGTNATVSAPSGGNSGGYTYEWKQSTSPVITTTTTGTKSFSTPGNYTVTVKDSKGCSSDALPFTIQGSGATCNFSVVTTPVTCYGGNDGKVVIYKDGVPLDVPVNPGGSGTGTGSSDMPQGKPGSCMTPSLSPYSCSSHPEDSQSSGTISVTTGQTVFINSPSFSGNLLVGGGTLVVCGNATIQNFNYTANPGAFTLVVNGTANLNAPNLNLLASSTVKNYGTLSTKSIGFNGSLENHGTLNVDGDLSFNTSANSYLNTGTITVNSNFNNKFTTINGGTFYVKGVFNNNEPTSLFVNNCKLTVDGNFNNNKGIENRGFIIVPTSTTTFNQNSVYKGYSGSVLYTSNFTNNGLVDGIESCASIRVKQSTNLTGTSILKGNTSLCDANGVETASGQILSPAGLNCSCGGTSTTPSSNPVVWTGYPGVTGNTNSNLSAGTNTVVITLPGCNTTTLTYTITQPSSPITASVSVIGGTATVSAPAGGNGGPYKYRWSPDNVVTNVGSRNYSNNGSYTVWVQDSKQCEGPGLPFNVTSLVEKDCHVIVKYLVENKVLVKVICPDSLCKYQIRKEDGSLMAYGSVLSRPCQDSVITSVNCDGKIIKTGIDGSGRCTPDPCDPATDPSCPCNLSTDPNCPGGNCFPTVAFDCPCQRGADPNCPFGCDETDPSKCPKDSTKCDPETDPGCPYLKVKPQVIPASCGVKAKIILTILNGSGNYQVYRKPGTHAIGGGSSPITLYDMPEGKFVLIVLDNQTRKSMEVPVTVNAPTRSDVAVTTFSNAGSNCKDQFMINITNAVSGPYKIEMPCCSPNYIENLTAVGGVLQAGPYSIPGDKGEGPFVIKVTDASCNTYDELVTKCNGKCPGETGTFQPALTKVSPSYKGKSDGSIILTNLPANMTAYWIGTNLYAPVTGTVLSGIGKGWYKLLILDNTTKCTFYYGSAGEHLSDGPAYAVKYLLVAGCNYEAVLSKLNEDGTVSSSPVAGPVTYTWINPFNGAQVGSGPQINISAIASSLVLGNITLHAVDGAGNVADLPFEIPKKCLPVTECLSEIEYEVTDPVCYGGNDGSINITSVSSGSHINWTTPELQTSGISNPIKTGLKGGKYSVAVISSLEGCETKTVDIYLQNPDSLEVRREELGTGGVKINVSKGKKEYHIIWADNNQDIATRTDLIPGTSYTVNVTDANNCSVSYTFVYNPCGLSKPETRVLIKGNETKIVNSTGMAPFSYHWKGGDIFDRSMQMQTNLPNGMYEVVVTDARGCKDSVRFNSNKCGKNITIVIDREATMSDLCTGQATLSLAGITDYSGYAILWDKKPLENVLRYGDFHELKDKSSFKFLNACSGFHTVAVVDPSGCVVESTFEIKSEEGAEPVCNENPLTISNPKGTSFARNCYSDTVNVNFIVKGGISPYTFDWTRTEPGKEPIKYSSQLPGIKVAQPGIYTVTVMDSRKCPVSATYTVTGPSAELSFTKATVSPVCSGNNGTLNLTITGGVGPYTVTWADLSTSSSASGIVSKQLPAGVVQTFLVKDSKNCSLTGEAMIQAVPFEGRIYYSRKEFCPGLDYVSLTAEVLTGYKYKWTGAGIDENNQYASQIRIATPGTVKLVYTPVSESVCTQIMTDSIVITERTISQCKRTEPSCDIIDVNVPELTIVDQCALTIRNVDSANVEARYFDYIEEAKRKFRNNYISSVMGSLEEELTIEYSDNEQHYTLYYYDQAGNLVRTIPPAGVKPLSEEQTKAVIADMKDNKVSDINTQHNLATTYTYNSLNQLIKQDMPDHNRQDLWETNPALSLPSGYKTGVVDYVTADKGLLFANTDTESKLYLTDDTGKVWTAGLGLQFGDILDIYTVTGVNQAWYAVGKNGLFLKGSKNGSEWTLFSSPTTMDLINVYFSTDQKGRVVAADGTIWTTTNGGGSWSSAINTLQSTNLLSITDVWNEGEMILVSGTKEIDNKIVSILYFSPDGGGKFDQQEFTAGPYGTLAFDGSNTIVSGSNGVMLQFSGGKLKVVHNTNVHNKFIKQLIAKPNHYTALITDGPNSFQNSGQGGNIYSSSDGKTWTAVTSGNNILKITELANNAVSAITNAGTYGNSTNWNNFTTLTAVNATNVYSTQLNNISKSLFVNGPLLSDGSAFVQNREVVLASSIAYRTETNNWQKVDITGYNFWTTKSMLVHAADDWLLLEPNGNLYRTQKGSGSKNVLSLTNNNAPILTGVHEIYKTMSGYFALKTDGNLIQLTLNANGSVTSANKFTIPSSGFYSLADFRLSETDSEKNASGAEAFATFTDGTFWVKSTGESWINKTLQPSGLHAVVSSTSQTMYAGGSNGELFKKVDVNNKVQWQYQKLISADPVAITDVYIDAGALRLATNEGIKTYNPATWSVTSETGTEGTINEAYGNIAVTESGKIYTRNGSNWQLNYSDPENKAIKNISTNLAAGNQNIYYYQSGSWAKALPVKIQPIQDMAQGKNLIAVGNQGTVLVSEDLGTTWKPKPLGSTQNLNKIAAYGDYAVAGSVNGSLYYSNNKGDSWTAVSSLPGSGEIRSIVMTGNTSVWVVKDNIVLYSNNLNTYNVAFTATEQLYGIHVDAQGYGYVVGNGGAAYRLQPKNTFTADQKTLAGCNGTAAVPSDLTLGNLSIMKICTDGDITDDKGTGIPARPLRTVAFTDKLTGYITGTSGLVLKTVDGGYRWKPEGDGTGSSTPILALADGENGTLVNGNDQIQSLRDRAQKMASRFWYDQLGRLVLSQNSKQYNVESYLNDDLYSDVTAQLLDKESTGTARAYSYTLYDEIGRISEVGELITRKPLSTGKHESQVAYNTIKDNFINSGVKQQITSTYYDEIVFEYVLPGFEQQNLRPRVASVTYADKDIIDENGLRVYDKATHYSYDIHGNVKTLVQEIKSGGTIISKRLDYDYDLVSGKVNFVYYQKGKADQLIHKYSYDGDNRITEVRTSTDGVQWTKDVQYDYYAHGPLARATIGEDKVETQNYAYTLQGWIKGVKGEQFSYALGYFDQDGKKDYTAIGGGTQGILTTPVGLNEQGKNTSLYNGNISTWTSLNKELNYTNVNGQRVYQPWTQQFEYDQLNRIKSGKTLGSQAYKNTYSYDANGNLTSLNRFNESGVQFDQLSYNYENKKAGYLANTNKLRSVSDEMGASIHTSDIDHQGTDNYEYDEVGNLNKDVQEQIKNIEWTVYGKIKSVTRESGSLKSNLSFEYDASGNRTVKIVTDKNGNISKTFYIRDAQGNVMSTYEIPAAGSLTLDEQYIYGSSRLGVLRNERRSYELTDHLGNVRSVVGDLKDVNDEVEVISATDYYPFGMIAKAYNSQNYRYGYNGKERDTEGTGGGESTYDYGFRIYNPQIARFLSVDPLSPSYPWWTPYQFAANRPITSIDLDGLEAADVNENSQSSSDPNEVTSLSEVVITGSKPLTDRQKLYSFGKGFIRGVVVAAAVTTAVVVTVGTMGAAGPFIMGGLIAYGAYETGKTGYAVAMGEEFWTGEKLTEEERWERGGELAGGLIGGVGGAKGGIKLKAKLFGGKKGAGKITEGVNEGSPSSEIIKIKDIETGYWETSPGEGYLSMDITLETGAKFNFSSAFKLKGKILEFVDPYLAPEDGIQNHKYKNKLGREFLKNINEQLKIVAEKLGAEEHKVVDYDRAPNSSSAKPGKRDIELK